METFNTDALLEAISGGNYAAVAGFSLMIMVFLARILTKGFGKKWLDLVAAACGVVSVVASCLVVGDGSWQSIVSSIVSGLVVGATAVGFWELLGKRIEDAVKNRGQGVDGDTAPTE